MILKFYIHSPNLDRMSEKKIIKYLNIHTHARTLLCIVSLSTKQVYQISINK